MGKLKRKFHTAEFKAKVGLEAFSGMKTLNELSQEHGVHPCQISQWKKELQEKASELFGQNEARCSSSNLT